MTMKATRSKMHSIVLTFYHSLIKSDNPTIKVLLHAIDASGSSVANKY